MADWQFAPENKAVLKLFACSTRARFNRLPGWDVQANPISAMEYYKVLLTILGYRQGEDFEYGEDMLAFAKTKGLYEVARVTKFTISDLATATREALTTEVKGTGKTLAETLVEKGALDKDVAIEVDIYEDVFRSSKHHG